MKHHRVVGRRFDAGDIAFFDIGLHRFNGRLDFGKARAEVGKPDNQIFKIGHRRSGNVGVAETHEPALDIVCNDLTRTVRGIPIGAFAERKCIGRAVVGRGRNARGEVGLRCDLLGGIFRGSKIYQLPRGRPEKASGVCGCGRYGVEPVDFRCAENPERATGLRLLSISANGAQQSQNEPSRSHHGGFAKFHDFPFCRLGIPSKRGRHIPSRRHTLSLSI